MKHFSSEILKIENKYCRRASHEFRRELIPRESTGMPTELSSQDGTDLSFTLQPELMMSSGTSNTDGRVSICSSLTGEEISTGSASHRIRPTGHSHSHSHSRSRTRTHAEADCSHPNLEVGESSASFSELRYLFCCVQKSLPFIIILCSKLILQHALGKHIKILWAQFDYSWVVSVFSLNQLFILLQGWQLESVCLQPFYMLIKISRHRFFSR